MSAGQTATDQVRHLALLPGLDRSPETQTDYLQNNSSNTLADSILPVFFVFRFNKYESVSQSGYFIVAKVVKTTARSTEEG